MLRGVFFVFFFLGTLVAHGVEVAFFIRYKADGSIERYEKEFPYSHVAIRVGELWLEAKPYYGVRLSSDVSDMGQVVEILSHPEVPEPDDIFLAEVLGKKYFIFADWSDPGVYSCTKLVAKYLGIPPNPMDFDPALWGNRFHEYLGKPGLSVSELYGELKTQQNYSSHVSKPCLKALSFF